MVKNFLLDSHVLEDPIVLDGIAAINRVEQANGTPVVISGGMAVSSYLPQETHRHTIDLDFNMLWGGNTEEFWDTVQPILIKLREKEYEVSSKKQNSTFDINYSYDGQRFMIQHQRRSLPSLEKNRYSIEREFTNRRHVVKGNLEYAVISPEDLMVRKLARMFKFVSQSGLTFPQLRTIPELQEHIDEEKQRLIASPNRTELDILHLRMEHDLYDIKRLGAYVGVNQAYLAEAVKDWTTGDEKIYVDTLKRICLDDSD